ncbi:MAG: molybdopterin converting factor subunit 1 [Archangium sp.]|nr:molybdopterin converting factor subunit 1 [Archangium sp.]
MKVTVRYFAIARERVKASVETIELSAQATVSTLRDALAAKHPPLVSLFPQLRFALNEEFVDFDASLEDGCEVALIPPVAGGAPLFRVQAEPLSLDEVIRAVSRESQGGLVTFTGAVRDHSKGVAVTELEYEAYVPMAEKKLAEIANEAREKWPGTDVAVLHRVGTLKPGELAVVIAVSAPHRKEAFRACEYVIDRLKEDVPIWKKEFTADGQVWVGLGP